MEEPSRSSALPEIDELQEHPSVNAPHGPIYLLKGRESEEWMNAVLDYVAPKPCPKNRADAVAQGYVVARAKDKPVFLWRNLDGSLLPKDDKKVVWARPGSSVKAEERRRMVEVRERAMGEDAELTADKAKLSEESGDWEGGIAFERNEGAESLSPSNRCYPLSTSYQASRSMNAPQRSRKTMGRPLDSHASLVKDILEVGAIAGMAGLSDGPEGLKEMVDTRAEYLNIPRVGSDCNTAFPSFQLNIASAVDADDDTDLAKSLGTFGSSHADSGDSASMVTAMTVMTRPHPDAEEDIFFIQDYGIAIVLDEFDTVYFCGLRFHGGSQPRYKFQDRTSDVVYVRLTLIGYSPSGFYDAVSSQAFLAVPTKEGVYKVLNEMSDWSKAMPFERRVSAQATYTSDGESIMSATSSFDHLARNIVQLVGYAIEQYPRYRLPRFDKEKILSALSFVENGERKSASSWEQGPGWSGDDVAIGKVYTEDLLTMPEEDLQRLHNSDVRSPYPYGNKKVYEHASKWQTHRLAMARTIPLCFASDKTDEFDAIANPTKRRSVTKHIREGGTVTKTSLPKKKAAKVIVAGVVSGKKRRRSDSSGDVPSKRKKARIPVTDTPKDADEPGSLRVVPHLTGRDSRSKKSETSIDFLKTCLEGQAVTAFLEYVTAHSKLATTSTVTIVDVHNASSQLRSMFHLNDIRGIWQLKEKLQAGHSLRTIETYAKRGQLMLLTGAAWYWLEDNMRRAYQASKTNGSHWLQRLATDVKYGISTGKAITLDASHYHIDVPEDEAVVTIKARRQHAMKLDTEENVLSVLRPVLVKWFAFPSTIQEAARGKLVTILVSRFGPGVVYLSDVWEVYDHISSSIDPTSRKPTTSSTDKWMSILTEALGGEDVDHVKEILVKVVDILAEATDGLVGHSTLEDMTTSTGLEGEVGSFRGTYRVVRYSVEEMNMFFDQIQRLYVILDSPAIAPVKPPRTALALEKRIFKFQELVFNNTDKKLPFRDKAISRRTVLQSGGPFSAANLRTRAGFFSVLVHRAITHQSDFLTIHGERMFSSLRDFKTRLAKYKGKEPTFFCTGSAYGAWTALKTTNSDQFWEASGKPAHTDWLLGSCKTTFESLVSKLSHSNEFPSIGPLIAYLIAADYAIAGVIDMPDDFTMGRLIFRIGKGGLKGLTALGFKVSTEDETADAFHALYDIVCKRISVERRAQMDFNVFVLEHMLCKFKRLSIKAYTDILECV
ncbi:hypothetical protein DFP72DRAFT_806004 [Ephemerocybe angulata]|uniref:Uncharacterized protein n=1 Tax=Ephemerocybe angulata TaxID=980116 RepID=A0A8H6I9E8_9AGAR|nr:hypothetical protein DFP72DRAFT_806004 [Tulosesus angulatus]